jgi:hypothetical protein
MVCVLLLLQSSRAQRRDMQQRVVMVRIAMAFRCVFKNYETFRRQ